VFRVSDYSEHQKTCFHLMPSVSRFVRILGREYNMVRISVLNDTLKVNTHVHLQSKHTI